MTSFFLFLLQISGSVVDAHGVERYVIKGYWDEEFNVAPVKSGEGKNKEIGPFKQLWKADPLKLVVVALFVCL